MRIIEYDVLVIGSGGAGLRASISAAEAGAKVLLVGKGRIDRSGATLVAGANVSADVMCDGKSMYELGLGNGDPNDSKEKWLKDIIREGVYLNNRKMTEQYVETAPMVVGEMVKNGIRLIGKGGDREIGTPGSSILDFYCKRAKDAGVEMLADTELCDLAMASDGSCAGAVFMDVSSGEIFAVRAAATVLATGGMHNCYTFTSGTTGLCGEGQAAAMRAGAEMTLMEMVTFCPGVITYPPIFRGSIFPYILSCHGFMQLLNKDGEEFLGKHIPQSAMDVALNSEWNKLLLCYAMYQEVNVEKKGDEFGGVLFTVKNLSPERQAEFEEEFGYVRKGATGPMMEFHDKYGGIPSYGAAHYFDGGLAVNEKMESSIAGLFGAGECTGGNFGANRVSAATTQMLVQGYEAGKNAAAYAKENGLHDIAPASLDKIEEELMKPFSCRDGEDSGKLRRKLQETVSANAGVVVCQEGLEKGLADVLALAKTDAILATDEKKYNRGMIDWLELRSMQLCAEAIFKSSLARKESRGVFIRSDMMFTDDDNWLKATKYRNGSVWLEDVEQSIIAPPAGKHGYIENIEAIVSRLSY